MTEYKLGDHVSVDLGRLNHVSKHGFQLNIEEMLKISDETKGIEGVHVFHDSRGESLRTVVINGVIQNEGKNYGIFRTMWKGGSGSNQKERNGLQIINHYTKLEGGCEIHGIIPYAHGFCPFCDLK